MINDIANEQVSFWKAVKSNGVGSRSIYDVRIGLSSDSGKNRNRISITFGKSVQPTIGPYVRCKVSSLAVVPNRIYFGFYGSEHVDGAYKISRTQKGMNPKIQCVLSDEEAEVFRNYWREGYYKLRFDETYKLYYVDSGKES